MSLPSFPSEGGESSSSHQPIFGGITSPGAGSDLPIWLLGLCGALTGLATAVSVMSITLQLKNYRKPMLQRCVVRIMVMVPLYAISSLIALFSLEAAFFIDAVRDLYEAFVIYTFFQLLITYLGGERSLLITLHGRPPIPHPAPFNWFLRPMDVSDPWTLLNLKRGVLQYVQVKPILVIATIVLKATGTYREGKFASNSGYTYISIVYNISICLSLYCLAMFWVCVNRDLTPFRPVPKFLCVKGILFFSFWQGIGISLLVAAGLIKKVGVYTDAEHMSQALVDSLICFEMPIFAIAHQYAFQASDYIDPGLKHQARLPFTYALRDAFGLKDVWQDTKDTFRGRGISYQAYEPAEGALHYGLGRQKRIRAGLRYSKGGKAKYWIPTPGNESRARGDFGPIASLKRRVDERLAAREGYAPLLPKQAARVVHDDPVDPENSRHGAEWTGLSTGLFADSDSDGSDAPSLDFHSVKEDEDDLYDRARRIGYAGFPNIDVSQEEAKRRRWEEEEAILAGRRWGEGSGPAGPSRQGKSRNGPKISRSRSDTKGKNAAKRAVYGAWADGVSPPPTRRTQSEIRGHNPTGEGEWLTGPDDGDASPQRSRDRLKPPGNPRRRSDKSRGTHTSPFALGDDDEDSENDDDQDSRGNSSRKGSKKGDKPKLPSDARDLVVEDQNAVEEARARERRRGEPQTKAPAHVYVHRHSVDQQRRPEPQKASTPPKSPAGRDSSGARKGAKGKVNRVKERQTKENGVQVQKPDPPQETPVEIEEVYSPALPDERTTSESVPHALGSTGSAMDHVDKLAKASGADVTAPAPVTPYGREDVTPISGPYLEEDNPWA